MFARTFIYTLIFICLAISTAAAQTKLLRFPDIYGDRVVFSYASDLWTAVRQRRNGNEINGASGNGSFRQIFARRQMDRLYRAI